MDPSFAILSLVCIYALLAAIDGIWIHFVWLSLHRRIDCRREHLLHTIRAALFPLTVLLLVNLDSGGVALWIGICLAGIDFAFVAWDAAEETTSREAMRGLPAIEAALHSILQALHAGIIALAVGLRPRESWSIHSAWDFPQGWTGLILGGVISGGALVFILHLILAWTGRHRLGETASRRPAARTADDLPIRNQHLNGIQISMLPRCTQK